MARIPYLGTTLPPEPVMVRYFGPKNDVSRQVWVRFAGHPVQVNKALAGNVEAAGADVEAAGLAGVIRDVGGFRTTVGGSGSPIPYSMHQYGAAFDINEDGGPDGNWHTMTLPPRLVAILADHHWFCGQNWTGASRDGGHFQFTGGKAIPASGQQGPSRKTLAGGALTGLGIVAAAVGITLGAAAVIGTAGAILAGAAVAWLARSQSTGGA